MALGVTFETQSRLPGRLTFVDAIGLGAGSQPSSLPGDGGALVWRRSDAAVIGMLLASDRRSDGSPMSYVLPIGPALNSLAAALLGPSDS